MQSCLYELCHTFIPWTMDEAPDPGHTAPAADMGVCLLGPMDVEDTIAGLEERVACARPLARDGTMGLVE